MKKYYIPIFILGLLVLFGGYSFFTKNNAEQEDIEPVATTTEDNPFTMAEDGDQLVGLELRIPGLFDSVTLEKGVKDFDISGAVGGTIVYLSSHTVEVKLDEEKYLVAPVVISTGGTGNFLYLILFKERNGQWQQLGDTLLGDRIFLNSLLVDDTYTEPKILASVLVRGESESLSAEPTIEKTIAFEIKNEALVETVYYAE